MLTWMKWCHKNAIKYDVKSNLFYARSIRVQYDDQIKNATQHAGWMYYNNGKKLYFLLWFFLVKD